MYSFIETFVGAGGAHLGFKNLGFISRYVLDIDENSLKTLVHNNPSIAKNCYIDHNDILKVDPREILDKSNLKVEELDVLFGGIVCKGFSLAGERSPNDERNYFYHRQLEIIKEMRPKISIIENVKGILNAKVLSKTTPDQIKNEVDSLWKKLEDFKGKKAQLRKENKLTEEFNQHGLLLRREKENILKNLESGCYLVSVMEDIKQLYEDIDYRVEFKVLNSAWYGAATKRERVIIVAVRNDIDIKFYFPKPTHMDDSIKNGDKNWMLKNLRNPVTVHEALKTIKYDSSDLDNFPMKHNKKTVDRFKYIPQGKNIVSVMNQVPKDLKISSFYSRGNTMRLDPNKPSPTLVPGHSNFPIHPEEDRSITVREAATITGFPNNYKFFGSHTKRCEFVGNAVPIKLAEAVALSCKEFLDAYYKNTKNKNF